MADAIKMAVFHHTMQRNKGDFRTGCIGKIILSAPDLVLEPFSFASGGGNLGLHLLAAHVGHLDWDPWVNGGGNWRW
jgi:hypothetical protein